MPRRMAHRTRLTLSWTPNFSKIWDLWHAAVLKLMPRIAAISLVFFPPAINFSTSISRADSFVGVDRGVVTIGDGVPAAFNDVPGRGSASAGNPRCSIFGDSIMAWMVARFTATIYSVTGNSGIEPSSHVASKSECAFHSGHIRETT